MLVRRKILILGGTKEAREIAARLVQAGHSVTTSLAGVTTNPLLPPGSVRSGGFGGAVGLRDYLFAENIEILVDATHPFAAIMSRHANEAVQGTPIQFCRFERPAWVQTEADHWQVVESLQDAVQNIPKGAHVFVTTGRKELSSLLARPDLTGVIRTVEPPAETMPEGWRVILERPPHDQASEAKLFHQEGFTHLVTKNAGGRETEAKIQVARRLGLTVIMVQRPLKPDCATFTTVESLIARLGSPASAG
jgi:precorrin-6A/cobalt-precorrin-6A reductase